MRVEELKSKVLQLAIQGKLVPQDESDIPASVLLEEIKKEKKQLIKDKKIKKETDLEAIQDEDKPFELPNRWEFIKLGDFIRFVGGNQPPKSTFKYEYTDGYIRLIQIRDYKSDSHITFIPYEKAKKFCSKDDIMIGRYGPPIFQILRGIEGAYNVALMKADPIGGIEKDYLYYLLKDSVLLKKLEFLASRTCGQDGIDMDTLKSYIVGLPPREEQLRIVAKLEEIYEKIDELNYNKKAMLKNISDMRNKVLQLAIKGKLVERCEDDEPVAIFLDRIAEEKEQLIKEKKIKKEKTLSDITDDEKPFELPNGWKWCRLGELFNIVRGSSPRPKGHPKYFTEEKTEFNWVTIKDITQHSNQNYLSKTNEYLTEEGSLKSRFIEKGEIIIAVSGSIGKTVIMGIDGYIYDGLAGLKNIVKDKVFIDYIYIVLMTWKENLNQISEGTSIQNINTEKLNLIPIALPPLEEQKRIVVEVDEIMGYLDELEKTILEQDII